MAAPTAATAPAPPAPPPAEDAANDSGSAIATFSGYNPSNLPDALLRVLAADTTCKNADDAKPASNSNGSNDAVTVEANKTTKTQQEDDDDVIEILEESNDGFLTTSSKQQPQQNQQQIIEILDDSLDSFPVVLPAPPSKEEEESTLSFASIQIPSHSSPACESALLASVSVPKVSDESASNLLQLAESKSLSPLQLEGVSLAISRHNRLLYNNSTRCFRAGFFLGDAAGIGKGRQIAAVIRDSACRGRSRHLWVSVSRELSRDAQRDLQAIACHVPVHDALNVLKTNKGLGASGEASKGVLFVTYALLVSGQGKRMEEIIKWLAGGNNNNNNKKRKNGHQEAESAFDGVIVFDECHKAKNLEADTHTSKLVIKLQERLAKARVIYASATGVSDIKHLVYANRLGLWGAGCALYPTFDIFCNTLANRGMGSLEMLALEMKQMGIFVARTLSWEGARFETMEVPLSSLQIEMYDGAVQWWLTAKDCIEAAIKHMGCPTPPILWRAYWSAHQRFFKEMAICAKVSSVVKESLIHLENGCAVVIGLQSTGEASTQAALEELGQQILLDSGRATASNKKVDFENLLLPSLVSTCRSTMTSFVRNHFPVAPPKPEVPKVPPLPDGAKEGVRIYHAKLEAEAERIRNMPPPQPIPELLARRHELVHATRSLVLPANPLDDLIDKLGGEEEVAELTGRSGRIVRYKDKQHYHYVRRVQEPSNQKSFGLSMPKSSEDFDKLNIVEKRKFMEGRKSVAIISDAASTGISLHAAMGSGAAHKRRVHFTIELPWAADKAIQQLGRSHRSGQLSAPIYKMVVTELGGERRFGAAVSKRMANLGALTKGDRRAATGSDLSEFDIDSVYGRRALNKVYQCLILGDGTAPTTAPSRHGNEILDEYAQRDLGPMRSGQDEYMRRIHALAAAQEALQSVGLDTSDIVKNTQVKVFLNRIAGIPVQKQKLVFSLFMSALDDVVSDAKATGEFEGSVEDVKATHIELDGKPEKLAVDKRSGAATTLTRVKLDRGISLEVVAAQSLDDARPIDGQEQNDDGLVAECGWYLSKRQIAGRHLVLYAKRKVDPETNTGEYDHDPLGLMVVTRPNTGKNPCEMPTQEMRFKYRLLLSSNDFKKCVEEGSSDEKKENEEAPADILRRSHSKVAKFWDEAYKDSYSFEHNAGLAPRRSQLGLITGAVLHVLPALEKAVIMRRQSERALRVARVEISATGERIVGIRFPLDDEAMERLKTILAELSVARSSRVSEEDTLFRDEAFSPIDQKSMTWATTERKTMRSFFGVAPGGNETKKLSGSKRKGKITPDLVPLSEKSDAATTEPRKKITSLTKPKKSAKKTANIKSFFAKK